MKSKIMPMEGETIIAEIEGEMWAASSNPIARLIGKILKILNLILGIRQAGYLVLTSNRIIFYKKSVALWVFPTFLESSSLLPQAVSSVGYIRKGSFLGCFCPTYYLQILQNNGTEIVIQVKGATETEVVKYANVLYNATRK